MCEKKLGENVWDAAGDLIEASRGTGCVLDTNITKKLRRARSDIGELLTDRFQRTPRTRSGNVEEEALQILRDALA